LPKRVLQISAFEAGLNKRNDPRDIEGKQLVEAKNIDVSNPGRIVMPGEGRAIFNTVNSLNQFVSPSNDSSSQSIFQNNVPISDGYGIFSFVHDYNFKNSAETPQELGTEFICINDGADIKAWRDNDYPNSFGSSFDKILSLGTVHSTSPLGESSDIEDDDRVKPIYYKADNGLRVCDANFSELDSGVNTAEVLTDETDSTDPAETAITVETGKSGAFAAGEYIRIDSEVMKITAIADANTLTVERGRFGSKIEIHDDDSTIYKLNVPKIFTHINRPMLKKAGANVHINRWLEDIQVPEAPKYGALSVYNSNIIGYDGTNITANSTYPVIPERVNLGISTQNVETNEEFTIDDVNITSESTALETVLVITLADSDINAIDATEYNFAVGKFITISNATGDLSNLNGIHEIVGFGTGGTVKISADIDIVGVPGTGSEVVILEDEIMDDNLKQKYIFGMSYLYDGGSDVMQESNITTAVTNVEGSVDLLGDAASFPVVDGWRTIQSDLASGEGPLSTSNPNNFDFIASRNVRCTGNNDYLFYENTSITITADTNYDVSGAAYFNACSGASFKVYVGLGPDATSTTGATELTVSQPSGGTGLVEFSGVVTSGNAVDADVGVTIKVIGANGGGTEYIRLKRIQVSKQNTAIMSHTNALDFRNVSDVAKGYLTFLCNNSRTGAYNATTQYNSWNERIEGFRIYMKQVDVIGGGLADDWTMLYDVNLKEGTYVMHAKDSDEELLRLGDISSNDWNATNATDAKALVTGNVKGDSIKIPPLLTYEALNGYKSDTNLSAMYKTSAVVQRKVYIGNLKIGNKRFPDRMIKAAADKYDIFPDDSAYYIDVATSDGENIIKLESFGEYLLQFKEKTTYLIKVTSEGEDLVSTWSGAGIMHPSQSIKTPMGVFWANSSGLFIFDGQKINNVTTDTFGIENWSVAENNEKPIILGYDYPSNKILIITNNVSDTSNGGYIYDINNNSMTQCQNLFSWYPAANSTDDVKAHQEPL